MYSGEVMWNYRDDCNEIATNVIATSLGVSYPVSPPIFPIFTYVLILNVTYILCTGV